MTPTQQQLALPGAADELAEATAIIATLLDQCLSFTSPNGAHKALRSIYSPRGTCQTSKGCSELCTAWHEAIEAGAAWLARRAARGEG